MSSSDNLLNVFALFTLDESEWTVDAAATRLGLSISPTYRIFRSLSDAGLISAFATGRYVLGPAIIQLDRQTRLLDPLIMVAKPVMQQVVADLQVPGVLLLCRLFQKRVMCIHQEFKDRPTSTVSYERGRPMPLFRGAASKVIFANMPIRLIRNVHEAHRAEMVEAGFESDWEAVKLYLRRLRSARVCITSGELDSGMTGIAIPLRDPGGAVNASLGFVLPDGDAQCIKVTISKTLDEAAKEIEARFSEVAVSDVGTDETIQTPS